MKTGPLMVHALFKMCVAMMLKFFICVIFVGGAVRPALAQTDIRSYNWFWCFYESGRDVESQYTVYRPVFMQNFYEEKIFEGSLMPLGYWRYVTKRNDHKKGFFGFYDSMDYTHSDARSDYDLGIFPFVFYGNSPRKEDRYCMIWPVGGTLKQKFGYDRISPWIFPGVLLFFLYPPGSIFSYQTALYVALSILPVYMTFDEKDYHAWSIMWPIIHKGKSSTRDDFRVMPFYAHNQKKGFYDNYSWLLLINYQQYFYRNDVHRTFFFFPFYGRKWSETDRIGATTLLWPFFSWGYDARNAKRSINFPWPLVQIQDSDDPFVYKRIFFPFYGRYHVTSSSYDTETFFVTPLYFSLKKKAHRFDSHYQYYALIFWYFKRDYNHKSDPVYGKHWRYYKLWPLFHYEYNDRGDLSFNLLSILPFRDPDGYERMYQPFFSLIEYRETSSGEKRLGLLLRTYFQRWDDHFFQMRIPLLLTYESEENTLTEFSFLLSMFGYSHKNDGRYVRIFWIPFRIGDALIQRQECCKEDEDKTAFCRPVFHLSDIVREEPCPERFYISGRL